MKTLLLSIVSLACATAAHAVRIDTLYHDSSRLDVMVSELDDPGISPFYGGGNDRRSIADIGIQVDPLQTFVHVLWNTPTVDLNTTITFNRVSDGWQVEPFAAGESSFYYSNTSPVFVFLNPETPPPVEPIPDAASTLALLGCGVWGLIYSRKI